MNCALKPRHNESVTWPFSEATCQIIGCVYFRQRSRRMSSDVWSLARPWRLDEEEKASIVRLGAANLDTMQAWQIRMNLQDVFTMPSVASARKFLRRWHAWVSTCDLQPMKKVSATIMAKADEILRSISSNLSNGLLEAI